MEALRLVAIPLLFVVGFGLLVAALFGRRVRKISVGGIDLSSFTTRGARTAAGAVGLLFLFSATALAVVEVLPLPFPSPESSGAAETSSANPTASPQPSEVPIPSTAPAPSTPPEDVAEWALRKRDELEVLGTILGEPSGVTLSAENGWLVQGFARGVVYRNPEETVVAIHGSVYDKWRLIGTSTEPAPNLGYPRRDQESQDQDYPWQRFDDGAVQCTPDSCYLVFGEVYTQWRLYQEALGYPTADVEVGRLITNTPWKGWFEQGVVVVDFSGAYSVCGSDGSTIASGGGGSILCSGPLPQLP